MVKVGGTLIRLGQVSQSFVPVGGGRNAETALNAGRKGRVVEEKPLARIAVADRRRELVNAAVRVIALHGVGAATTRAIVAEAGMSLASFHYAFTSRDELLEEVIAVVTEEEKVTAEATLSMDGRPVDPGTTVETALIRGLDSFLDLMIADPLREQALMELSQYAQRTPSLARTITMQYEVYYRVALTSLAAVSEVTGTRWTVPIGEAARHLITITDGLTTTWLADRNTEAARSTIRFAARALATLTEPHPNEQGQYAVPGATGAQRPGGKDDR